MAPRSPIPAMSSSLAARSPIPTTAPFGARNESTRSAASPMSTVTWQPRLSRRPRGGATGAFAVQLTAVCTDRYESTVRSASADLDADLGGTKGLGRAPRGRRWVTVVLQVTNVTPGGQCQAFSSNAGVVEMRLPADERAVAPANERSFDQLAVGATADRVYVFEVNAGARSFVLTGNAGEVLGRWTAEMPPAPGE